MRISRRMRNAVKDSVERAQDVVSFEDHHSTKIGHDITVVGGTEHCHHLSIARSMVVS